MLFVLKRKDNIMISAYDEGKVFLFLEEGEGIEEINEILAQYKIDSGYLIGFGSLEKVNFNVGEEEKEEFDVVVSNLSGLVCEGRVCNLYGNFSAGYKVFSAKIESFRSKKMFLLVLPFGKIKIRQIEEKFSIGYEEE